MEASEATKTCPDCAEQIKAEARKCRFCGYRFEEPDRKLPKAPGPKRRRSLLEIYGLKRPTEEQRAYDKAVKASRPPPPARQGTGLGSITVVMLLLTLLVPFLFVVPLITGAMMVSRGDAVGGVAAMAVALLIFVVRLTLYANTGFQSAV